MKTLTALVYFAAMAGAIAQGRMAPLPSLIIIFSTNQSAPVTVIRTSVGSWREDYVKQETVITNLNLTCISATSVATSSEGDAVLFVLHDATVYGPTIVDGKYGEEQKLQRMMLKELSIGLPKFQSVQVNGEILSAGRFAQRYKCIPAKDTP